MTEPTHALATESRIGYLPEERGLYEDMALLDTLLFLGQLEYLTVRRPLQLQLALRCIWAIRVRRTGQEVIRKSHL